MRLGPMWEILWTTVSLVSLFFVPPPGPLAHWPRSCPCPLWCLTSLSSSNTHYCPVTYHLFLPALPSAPPSLSPRRPQFVPLPLLCCRVHPCTGFPKSTNPAVFGHTVHPPHVGSQQTHAVSTDLLLPPAPSSSLSESNYWKVTYLYGHQ